jgi:uncharacterized caspase-like protein/Skp family chaperone for outer membrane proteins
MNFATPRMALAAVLVCAGAVLAHTQERRVTRADGASGRRLALVIGNQMYPTMPLRNPVQDARDVHAALSEVGFNVELLLDATKRQMDLTIGRFVDKVQPGDVALVYYAGHGVAIGGENFLLPVDVDTADEASVKYSSYSASLLHDRIAERSARLKILVLDACRNNPFRSSRSAAQGLAAMAAPGRGTFIAFATGPGSTADDNSTGRNGLFTTALLETLREPGVDLGQVFDRVRQRVDALSGGRQTPWSNSSVIGQFYFRDGVAASSDAAVTSALSTEELARREELAFWEAIRDSRNPAVFQDYLQRYGANGRFSVPARARLDALRGSPATAPSNAGPRLAYIDLQYLASNSVMGRNSTQQLQRFNESRAAVLNGPPGAARDAASAEQKQLTDSQQEAFRKRVLPLVQSLLREGQLNAIWNVGDSGVVWADKGLDQSGAVLKRLDDASAALAGVTLPVGETRVAYIDLQYLASGSAEGKSATAQIEAFRSKKTEALGELSRTLEALKSKLAAGRSVLSDSALTQLERDIDRKSRELQFAQQEAQQEQAELTNSLQNKFQERLNPIIDTIAKEAGVSFVISIADSGAVWANTALNLSPIVMKRLDSGLGDDSARSKLYLPTSGGVAYIDLQYLASNSSEGKVATAQIQAFVQRKTAELGELSRTLEALKSKLAAGRSVLSDSALTQLERDIDRKSRELEFAQESAGSEQANLTSDLETKFRQRLDPIIDAVAKDRGLSFVFSVAESGFVAQDATIDITKEILARLDASMTR